MKVTWKGESRAGRGGTPEKEPVWSRERHSWINRGEERVIVSQGSHIYRTSTAGQHRAELCRWRLGSSAAE